MARPIRVQFPGGFYHVMSRGNARETVFADDNDRLGFLSCLCRVASRLNWRLFTYCLMNNHYHLLLETREPNLAQGMRDVNGWYAQRFNRRHGRVGHVFQGRYKALIVQREGYLLELVRYIVRNPVRAGLCETASEWRWSSHRSILGLSSPLRCLVPDAVLGAFGPDATAAMTAYARFVASGADCELLAARSAHPTVIGSDSFVEDVMGRAECITPEVPRKQRATLSLSQYQAQAGSRDLAIRLAHASGSYSLAEIGRHFGLHYSTVSRICGNVLRREARSEGLN